MADEVAPPEDQPEPAPQPEAAPPSIDPEEALRVVSEHFGWDPRVADYEMREMRQRKEALERKERELQAAEDRLKRSTSFEAPPGYEQDPMFRTVSELAREMREDREERRRQADEQRSAQELSRQLSVSYNSLMARVSHKVDQDKFFEAMLEVYPDQSLLEKVGVERASQVVYRYLTAANPYGGNGNGNAAPPSRSRRSEIVVPAGTTGGSGAPPVSFSMPERKNFTTDQDFLDAVKEWTQTVSFQSLKSN